MKRLLVIALCLLLCCQGCGHGNINSESEIGVSDNTSSRITSRRRYDVCFVSIADSADFETQMLRNPIDQNTNIHSFEDLIRGNISSYNEYYAKWQEEINNALTILKEITNEEEYTHIMQGQLAWELYADSIFKPEVETFRSLGMLFPATFLLRGVRAQARAIELYGYEYLLTGKVSFLEKEQAEAPNRDLRGMKTTIAVSMPFLEYEAEPRFIASKCFSYGTAGTSEGYDELRDNAERLSEDAVIKLAKLAEVCAAEEAWTHFVSQHTALENALRAAEASWLEYIEETYQIEKMLLTCIGGDPSKAELARWERGCSRLADISALREGLEDLLSLH